MNIAFFRKDCPELRVFNENLAGACRELQRRLSRNKVFFELKLRRDHPTRSDRRRMKERLAERRRARRERRINGINKIN